MPYLRYFSKFKLKVEKKGCVWYNMIIKEREVLKMKSSMIDIIVSPAFVVFAFILLTFCVALLVVKRKKLPCRAKVILGGIIVVIIMYFVFIAFLSVMFGSAMPSAPPVPSKN